METLTISNWDALDQKGLAKDGDGIAFVITGAHLIDAGLVPATVRVGSKLNCVLLDEVGGRRRINRVVSAVL